MSKGYTELKKIIHQLRTVSEVMQKDIPHLIGQEAENHFSENFERQGFDGKKWKEVKRRDPSSPWDGFKYGANSNVPSAHPRRKGAKGKHGYMKIDSLLPINYCINKSNNPNKHKSPT